MIKKLLFLCFALIPSAAFAQKLEITSQMIECGRTGYQQPVTATFELKNKGRKLTIESVHPDCGCTTVNYPREVGAGEKFTISMTYDARQLGHFQKSAALMVTPARDDSGPVSHRHDGHGGSRRSQPSDSGSHISR